MALPLSYTRNNSNFDSVFNDKSFQRSCPPQGVVNGSYPPSRGPSLQFGLFPLANLPGTQWGVQDSNLRRHCQQIYSLSPLTARETPSLNAFSASDNRLIWEMQDSTARASPQNDFSSESPLLGTEKTWLTS